jgi:antitoxin component HigA of HigAB toxin-antitoxin module
LADRCFLKERPVEIHPIRNDDDHAAAVAEIERLWGSAAGTEEGDKLDILRSLKNTKIPAGQTSMSPIRSIY